MDKTAQMQHVDNVMSVVAQYGRNEEDSSDPIRRSWLRCVNQHGLDPTQARRARILPSNQLREHQEPIEEFLRVARAGMEQMYKRVASLGYVLLLTDAGGVTVDYIGNDSYERELKSAGLYLGADWNESTAGTCAVGTCLVEQTALTCHQEDHFGLAHIGLTCTSAPLFDPEGKLLAVLDMSALQSPKSKDSQHLAVHMTMMYAQMIEDANFLRHFRHCWILRLGTTWELVDVSGEAMLAFNDEGLVVGANTGARHIFSGALPHVDDKPVGSRLTELFGKSIEEIWRVVRSGSSSERAVITSESNRLFYVSVVHPQRRSAAPTQSLSAPEQSYPALDRLAGDDLQMQRLLSQAKRLVNRKLNILIHGETGTGKEVIAKALHESSARAGKPFVAVNCAAIPESLIESELFGYTPGSFTGGRSKGMKGLILQSDGGTLFLDEIGDMPLHLQTRLLRVLSEREVLPLGAEKAVPLDLTVIAASHRDLRHLISAGSFREDLYYRLCGATLHLPALRNRSDKPYLIDKVLREEAAQLGVEASISPDAMQALAQFGWPGNIRQLRNVLRFALALAEDGEIQPEHLPHEVALMEEVQTFASPALADMPSDPRPGAQRLLAALKRNKWNITDVSDELNICRATVYRQMKKYGIVPPNQQ